MTIDAFLPRDKPFCLNAGKAILNGQSRKVLDFWSWAYSDLMQNITRGYVAQYIVAWALGVDKKPNYPWESFDLRSPKPHNKRIEVKSTSFLQSWIPPRKEPKPLFVLSPRLPYSYSDGYGKKPEWNADIYVLSYLHCRDVDKVDVMNLDQWKFWVLTKADLTRMLNGGKSLTVRKLENKLKEMCPAFSASGLRDAILRIR